MSDDYDEDEFDPEPIVNSPEAQVDEESYSEEHWDVEDKVATSPTTPEATRNIQEQHGEEFQVERAHQISNLNVTSTPVSNDIFDSTAPCEVDTGIKNEFPEHDEGPNSNIQMLDSMIYTHDIIQTHCTRQYKSFKCSKGSENVVHDDTALIAAKVAAKRVTEWKLKAKLMKEKMEVNLGRRNQMKQEWRRSGRSGQLLTKEERLAESSRRVRQAIKLREVEETQEREMRWYKRKAALGLKTTYLEGQDATERGNVLLRQHQRLKKEKRKEAKKSQVARTKKLSEIATTAKRVREISCMYTTQQGSYILQTRISKSSLVAPKEATKKESINFSTSQQCIDNEQNSEEKSYVTQEPENPHLTISVDESRLLEVPAIPLDCGHQVILLQPLQSIQTSSDLEDEFGNGQPVNEIEHVPCESTNESVDLHLSIQSTEMVSNEIEISHYSEPSSEVEPDNVENSPSEKLPEMLYETNSAPVKCNDSRDADLYRQI